MKGFINFLKNNSRRKIYKFFLFILITIFLFLTKKCNAYAWTSINTGQVNTYFQTQDCYFINNQFNCQNGFSYKFTSPWQQNQNAIDWDIFPSLDNSDNAILINNLIYEYIPTNSITTSSTRKSIAIGISSNGYIASSGTGSTMNFSFYMFPYLTRDEDQNYIYNETFPINYNFKPYYCTYYNGSEWIQCNLILEIGNSNVFYFVLDLQEGITIEKIRLYFGSPNRQTILSYKTLGPNNLKVPDDSNIFYTNSSLNNISAFYVNYNDWRQHSNNNNIGLWWYPQGVNLYLPKFKMPTSNFTLQFDSNNYVNNTYKFNYDDLSNELKQQYLEQTSVIEQEIENQNNSTDNWFNDSLSGFADSSEANSLIRFFNALTSYPLQKFNQQLDFDLTNFNNWVGTNQFDSKLCWGADTILGDVGQPLGGDIFGVRINLPCPHTDIYTKLYSNNYSFYPETINGVSIPNGNDHNFYIIYKVIFDGILVYYLFLSCLDIYKYLLDSDRKEIEVLDL